MWGIFAGGCGVLAMAGMGMGGSFSGLPRNGVSLARVWVNTAHIAGAFVLGVVLLVAGISLINRRRGAVRLILIWAWSRIALAVVIMVLKMGTGGITINQMPQGLTQSAKVFWTVIGIVIGLSLVTAYPVFNLIWFRRGRIREEVRGW
ncbi:MAG: hypothetical protein KDA30_04520 [Phycisphaerales bacterium]|nr:hypothetical protein [Phycisphaerales bacterium]